MVRSLCDWDWCWVNELSDLFVVYFFGLYLYCFVFYVSMEEEEI